MNGQRCPRCGKVKPPGAFSPSKRRPGGWCRTCHRLAAARYGRTERGRAVRRAYGRRPEVKAARRAYARSARAVRRRRAYRATARAKVNHRLAVARYSLKHATSDVRRVGLLRLIGQLLAERARMDRARMKGA